MEPMGSEDEWTGIKASCVWDKAYRKTVTVLWSKEDVEIELNILRFLAVWTLAVKGTVFEPDFATIKEEVEEVTNKDLASVQFNIFKVKG
jgi:hypothetical protein